MLGAPLRVFVTGADGFIGQHVCTRLERAGFTVTRAVRRADRPLRDARHVVTGDLAEGKDLSPLLAGHEVILHLAGRAHILRESEPDPGAAYSRANVQATMKVARAALDGGVRRFVFMSTVGVLGDRSARPLTEDDPPSPVEPYARSKLQAERVLEEMVRGTRTELVILRPTLVYGPGCPGNMARLVRLVARGLPLPLEGIRSVRSLMGVDNLCALIERVMTHPAAAGNTFLAADGQDVSLPELIRYLAEGLDAPARLFRFPFGAISLAARIAGQAKALDKLTACLRVDVTKARRLLGWSPEVTVADGLRATGRWFAQVDGHHNDRAPEFGRRRGA